MLKAHQIICGFFHPKLSRLRHQYSGTEHISFRTSCNFSYIFGDFRNDGTVYLFHPVSATKLPCSTEQNGVCSRMDDCKWVLWSKGNIKTQHKGKRKKKKHHKLPTVLPEFHNCRLQDYNSTNIITLTWEY